MHNPTDQQREDDQTLLLNLDRFWNDRYMIQIIDDVWSARRLGTFTPVITADSGKELHALLHADYAE
jgi:hypothetical protein